MKEITSILSAYDEALQMGLQTALATLVHVEGSSYRRPGARMLIREDGQLTGAISGGCLEGDALRKALQVIHSGESRLVTYDSMDDDDAVFGLSLGCNGIVQVLIEPLNENNNYNPIKYLKALAAIRQPSVLVTLFNLQQKQSLQPGTCLLWQQAGIVLQNANAMPEELTQEAQDCLQQQQSFFKTFKQNQQSITCFFEFIPPPIQLVIAGAGQDVHPLMEMAETLGWQVVVADGRPSYTKAISLGAGCRVLLAKPHQVLQQIDHDAYTFYLLMTHNYQYDKAVLQLLLKRNVHYVGMLGPKKKKERMLKELADEGNHFSSQQLQALHSPVGLDIGAETPEEIALSILAEIKAVISRRHVQPLRNLEASIHNHQNQLVQELRPSQSK